MEGIKKDGASAIIVLDAGVEKNPKPGSNACCWGAAMPIR